MKTRRHHNRSAFTLLEITVVLALIVIVGAMAAPMFQGTFEHQRLMRAAESIRADWVRTRGTAMQNGETQVWTCSVSDGRFAAQPAADMSMADAGASVSAATGLTPTSALSGDQSFGKPLPQGTSIADVLVSEADSVLTMSQFSTSGESGTATVFFYPNGTCSNARITVQGGDEDAQSDGAAQVAVVMNGLTGTVRVVRIDN